MEYYWKYLVESGRNFVYYNLIINGHLARNKCTGTAVNMGECGGSSILLVKEIDIRDWEWFSEK